MAWTWHDGTVAERSDASGVSGGFMPPIVVFAGECVNADIYQELLRQHVVSWVQSDVAWQKMCLFWLIQRRPTRPNQFMPLAFFWRIGRHIHWTWVRWTSLSHAFCSQKARLRLTLIWLPFVRLSQQNGTGWQRSRSAKMRLIPPPPLSCHKEKWS